MVELEGGEEAGGEEGVEGGFEAVEGGREGEAFELVFNFRRRKMKSYSCNLINLQPKLRQRKPKRLRNQQNPKNLMVKKLKKNRRLKKLKRRQLSLR